MGDFNTFIGDWQAQWRLQHIADQRHGEQNGYTRPWILPASLWTEGLWPGIRASLPAYTEDPLAPVQKHDGVHNLKSSWMLCANLFFPFRETAGRAMLAGFLRAHVSQDIGSVERLELEYAEESPLDPQSLLGEPASGKRGAHQTSPDVAFLTRDRSGGQGLVLTESKLAEHSFYSCSGRKADADNPDTSRCLNWPKVRDNARAECWQMQWERDDRPNRRYWEYIRLSTQGRQCLKRCPAATAGYQLFRQQALAEAIAESGKYAFVASCVAYDSRNSDLAHSLSGTGVADFANGWGDLFAGRARFAAWTHQEWVSWVRDHDTRGEWKDWLAYVESRYGYDVAAA